MTVKSQFNITIVGDGPITLVLAHGFGSDQTAWRHHVSALSTHYRLVMFDYLGRGKSDISTYTARAYTSLRRYADDVLAIYDDLQLTDSIFIGHSVSAMIGALASQVQPERFRALVFVGASPRYLNDVGYVGGFERSDLNTLFKAMSDNYLGWANGFAPIAMGNPDRPELGREFAATLSAMRPDIAQSVAQVIFQTDFRGELANFRHPILILQSNQDAFVPVEVGDYLAANLPDSQIIHLNAVGHFPHLSAPDEVSKAIRTFVTRVLPRTEV